jgi:indolepyruvate ferredoxin oxidoreductase beta subunit
VSPARIRQDGTGEGARGVVVAGVGGQGVISVAQLILLSAWRSGFQALQSEIHGMSQRGGAVNSHVVFGRQPVSSPMVMDGSGSLLIAMEPLEALRHLSLLRPDAALVVSANPVRNIDDYPDEEKVRGELEKVTGVTAIDTAAHAARLRHRQAPGMILLGAASRHLPFGPETWNEVIAEYFDQKGGAVVDKNREAFALGASLR